MVAAGPPRRPLSCPPRRRRSRPRPGGVRFTQGDPVAERDVVWPVPARHLLADQHDGTGVGPVAGRERPAGEQRDVHHAQVVWAGHNAGRPRLLGCCRAPPSFDGHRRRDSAAADDQQAAHDPRGYDAGQLSDPSDQLRVEQSDLGVGRVRRVGHIECQRQDLRRVDPEVHPLHRHRGANRQPGHHEQRHGERHL